jgi:uncharacterized membrane protein (DUF2068 family)
MAIAAPPPHHPAPQAVDERTSPAALRTVAVFEATKGTVVLLLGLGLLALLHKDVEQAAESLLAHIHYGSEHRLSRAFLNAASKMTDSRLWALTAASMAYATVRYVEAYGLWNRRVWAEWFALLSGALYLPWEIYKLIERPNWIHVGVIALNVAIVLYMLYIRILACLPGEDCENKRSVGGARRVAKPSR